MVQEIIKDVQGGGASTINERSSVSGQSSFIHRP